MKKLFFLTTIVLVSCNNQPLTSEKETSKPILEIDSSKEITDETEKQSPDSISNINNTTKQNANSIVKVGENVVEGIKEQEVKMEIITFCDCIKQQHKIDEQMELAEQDKEIEALMEEMDKLSEGPCKALLSETQTTPEQREERKERIAKCLTSI